MRTRPPLGATAMLLLFAGCSEWPRYGHLPTPPDDAIAAPDDVQSLVEVEWVQAEEPLQTDDPTLTTAAAFQSGDALLVSGVLEGSGWWDDAVPVTFEDADCPGSSGPRSPEDPGDYIADVDFYTGVMEADGVLCASAEFADDGYGWDLLLVEVDECGIPTAFVLAPGATEGTFLGFGLGGLEGGWQFPVFQGDRYALLLAGYYPNDLEVVLPYRLGISLVEASSASGVTLCPLLPSGEEGR